MRWSPSTVAGFALQAGFLRKDLVLATAVALSASDGQDDVWNVIDATTDSKVVGLWQIPDWLVEEPTRSRLTNPVVNAQVAFYLWSFSGKSWDWSPTFVVGGWKLRIPEAKAAAAAPSTGESIASPVMLIDTAPNRRSALNSVRELISQFNGFRKSVGS